MGKGFDLFMQNPYWKELYDNAPSETLKKYYQGRFDYSVAFFEDEYDEEKQQTEISPRGGKLSKEDVQYLYDNSEGAEKAWYKKWLKSFPE